MTKGANDLTVVRDDPDINPNSLHDFHTRKRGPENIPKSVKMTATTGELPSEPKDPGHPYAKTKHISFQYYDQRKSNAPFGYEHFVSLPPGYGDKDETSGQQRTWPLILFLHGAGESQRGANESYASIRHGVPKIILCYDKLVSDGLDPPHIEIPLAPRLRKSKQVAQGDKSVEPVDPEVCKLVAENFITVTPSLNMEWGYGWNASILSALLDEIVERYRIDLDRIHVTGFSMGGYGTWSLGLHSPNRFATLMPICGGGDPVRASQIKHIPQWIHHGDLDDIIPLRASQQMFTALQKASGNSAASESNNLKFTRYPDLMHDSWTAAYGNPEVYRWMLERGRRVKGDEKVVPEGNKVVVAAAGGKEE